MKDTSIYRRWLITAIGCSVLGVGIGFCDFAQLGTDPFTVLLVGLVKQFGFTIGLMNIAVNLLRILFAFSVNRKLVSAATLIGMFSTSIGIDSVSWLNLSANTPELRVLTLAGGVLLYALGCALSIFPDAGCDSYNAFLLSAMKLCGKSCRVIRWITEAVFLLAGGLPGGVIGGRNACDLCGNGAAGGKSSEYAETAG